MSSKLNVESMAIMAGGMETGRHGIFVVSECLLVEITGMGQNKRVRE